MRKLMLSTVFAFAALAFTAGTASSYDITLEPAGEIALASLGALTLELSGITLRCPFTLTGHLNGGPIPLAAGSNIGAITEVAIDNARCSGGELGSVLFTEGEEFEWPLVLSRTPATGTLPNAMTELNFDVVGFNYLLAVFGGAVDCLYRGNLLNNRLAVTGSNPYANALTTIAAPGIPKVSGSFLCGGTTSFVGTLNLSPGQAITVS